MTDALTHDRVGVWVMATNTVPMAPPSSAPTPLPRRRMPTISVQVWSEQRPRFQKYYVDLDMSLSNAMKAMEDTFAFYASEKQYKTKIKQWKMTKYVNEGKMDCMLRKAKRRKTQYGKDTTFTLNGREVEQEKLDRFRKRKNLHNDGIGSSTVSTVSRVDYSTPPHQRPRATHAERSPVRAGSETGSSLAPSTIGSGSHSTSTSGSVLLRLSWNGLDMRALRDMEMQAYALFVDGNHKEILAILRQVLAGYEYLLGPDVDDVLTVVYNMGCACNLLGNESEAEALLKRAVSGYEMIHGLDDRRTLLCVADLASLYSTQARFEDSGVLLNRAARGLEHTPPSSGMVLEIFRGLAFVYSSQGFPERARDWFKRVITGYHHLGPGHEDALLTAEVDLCVNRAVDPNPATESLLVRVLAKCEARSWGPYERLVRVFQILKSMCTRYYEFKDPRQFEVYNHRLRLILSRVFGKDTRACVSTLYDGAMLANIYSEMGRYEEAESLLIQLKSKMDEEINLQLTGRGSRRATSVIFGAVRIHAEHYIRQSMWEDAEPLLLKAKSLEKPFCQEYHSRKLVEAFEIFRVGSGREAGALAHTQRTPGTHVQSYSRTPGQNVEDANTVISVGSAEFLQPLEESDWSGFPIPSLSPFSLHFSPQRTLSPTGVNRGGPIVEWENSGMTGMHGIAS